ncbi:uncharacterized protein LOC131302793 [Rhododendron vialii]|uniref:uncharacterized protein LOC131302793 n=1 Tax=Rhododendron vialii TaxID=182163 RepID=UPI0026601BC1|nr:uncharacterized protein LOC131302793 [Rhododendron vialii]
MRLAEYSSNIAFRDLSIQSRKLRCFGANEKYPVGRDRASFRLLLVFVEPSISLIYLKPLLGTLIIVRSKISPSPGPTFVYRGSCNGLVYLSENSNIVICNPATRECRLLPQPPYHTWDTEYVGFAFDSKTMDYIVVRFITMRQTTCVDHKIHIYCMSADSWKEITTTVPHSFTATYCYYQPCTFLDGVFYCLSYDFSTSVHLIDVLNTVEGLFEQRSMPAGLSFERWIDLCLLNNSPALIL